MKKRDFLKFIKGEEEIYYFESSRKIREKYFSNTIYLRGIIEFSNYCNKDCFYCGLRRSNKKINRYRMPPEEIVKVAEEGIKRGLRTIVLQSGDDPYYRSETISWIIKEIKSFGDVAITLSLGERSRRELEEWRKAGADRYLLKFETSNPELYEKLRPGRKLKQRLELLKFMKEIGYQIGSGNIIDLPFTTDEDLYNDLILMEELDLDMAASGPFIPHPDTPLSHYPQGDIKRSLRFLAAMRIQLGPVHIPATTALATLKEEARIQALENSANVVMPNITPSPYRNNYVIYPEKICLKHPDFEDLEAVKRAVLKKGFQILEDRGDSLKLQGRLTLNCNRSE